MNVRRVLGLGLFTFLMCAAVAASCQPGNPPQTYVKCRPQLPWVICRPSNCKTVPKN
jgi:hypothetical protein